MRYISKLLPDIESYEEYSENLIGSGLGMAYATSRVWRQKFSKSDLQDAFEMFNWYRESQFLMLEDGKELEALTTLFASLPHLREIHLLPNGSDFDNYKLPTVPDLTEFHPIAQETLVNLEPVHSLEVLPQRHRNIPDDLYERQLRALLAAAKRSGRKIQKLYIEDLSWSFFDSLPQGPQIQEYLRSLKHLEVAFEVSDLDDRRSVKRRRRRLREIVCAPDGLEILHVSFGEFDEDGDNFLFTDMVTPDVNFPKLRHWPHLYSLQLESVEISLTPFLDFLTSHSPSLRRLELFDIDLVPADLRTQDLGISVSFLDLFKEIRTRVQLSCFRIAGILNNFDKERWVVNAYSPYEDVKVEDYPGCLKNRVQRYVEGVDAEWDFGQDDEDFERGDRSWHRWDPD